MTKRTEFMRLSLNERHNTSSESRYWCGQYRLAAEMYAAEVDRLVEVLEAIAGGNPNPVAAALEALGQQ